MPKYTFFIEANVSQEFTVKAINEKEATSMAIQKFTSDIDDNLYCDIHTLNIVDTESYTPVSSLCNPQASNNQTGYSKYK